MPFIQFVRVEDVSTGHQYDVPESAVDPKAHKVLTDYPPNLVGIPRPPKHRVNKGAKPTTKAAQSAPTTERATRPTKAGTSATSKEK